MEWRIDRGNPDSERRQLNRILQEIADEVAAIEVSEGGSGGEILVADGMSAPPVMLTNEAEDDFLYSD
jgi:hypothetical protein